MLKTCRMAVAVAAGLVASAAWAADYQFHVIYSGDGVTTLAPDSQDPTASVLVAGDTFIWTISAIDGYQWSVLSGGSVFPMMAFGVSEAAERTGDFEFQLFNDGLEVLNVSEMASSQSLVHMGTNAIDLPTGLVFDFWQLSYALTSAIEVASVPDPDNPGGLIEDPDNPGSFIPDPDNPGSFIDVLVGPTTSSPDTLGPIFGMVDFTQTANSSTTIFAPVPEPQALALWLAGLAGLCVAARRRALPKA